MKKLFVVRMNHTYDSHYVLAKNFAEASEKVHDYIKTDLETKKQLMGILDSEGSLRTESDKVVPQVRSVEFVTDELIY